MEMLLITYFVYTVRICTPLSIIAVVCWSIYVILIIGPLGPAFIGILYTKYCISFVLSPFKTFLHARWSPSLFCHSSRALIFETAKWGVLKLCKIDKLPWYTKISYISDFNNILIVTWIPIIKQYRILRMAALLHDGHCHKILRSKSPFVRRIPALHTFLENFGGTVRDLRYLRIHWL